ncbi:MAG: DUF4397 domain-containing protein [Alphaproteobacteria bacterium]|nr:DUF4397 domain-containing protein [Alphaproteobacteria bacterium]MCB9697385.1 DUF4397 domain-containing protein [Alphaproteobacteria bacterium]
MTFAALLPLLSNAHAASAVQAVHLSPDAPNVDIWVNGVRALEDVPYLGVTPSVVVQPGSYDLALSVTGDANAVLGGTIDVADRTAYTLVAWDAVSNLTPAVLTNDVRGLARGSIRLQVSHGAVGVGTVDLWELSTGTKLVDDFQWGDTTRLDVPRGALALGLDLDEDAVPDVTFSVPDLGANTIVNVFAINDADGVALFAVYPDGTTARVNAD